jgi:hypothetical protein
MTALQNVLVPRRLKVVIAEVLDSKADLEEAFVNSPALAPGASVVSFVVKSFFSGGSHVRNDCTLSHQAGSER